MWHYSQHILFNEAVKKILIRFKKWRNRLCLLMGSDMVLETCETRNLSNHFTVLKIVMLVISSKKELTSLGGIIKLA